MSNHDYNIECKLNQQCYWWWTWDHKSVQISTKPNTTGSSALLSELLMELCRDSWGSKVCPVKGCVTFDDRCPIASSTATWWCCIWYWYLWPENWCKWNSYWMLWRVCCNSSTEDIIEIIGPLFNSRHQFCLTSNYLELYYAFRSWGKWRSPTKPVKVTARQLNKLEMSLLLRNPQFTW